MSETPFEPPADKKLCDRCGQNAWGADPPTWTCDGKLYCDRCYNVIERERRSTSS